jgi:hemerythrin superfamily protein
MGTVSKPRKQAVNALDLLTEQHDKVDELIEQLQDEELADDRKLRIFRELADNVAAHATMEEQLFYPAVRAKQTEDILLESTEEHLAIKRVLADLLETDVGDERFDARIKLLGEEIEHHAREEEEGELFPKVRRLMSAEELTALGSEMLAMFERLMASEPRKQVPKETRKPASI